MTLSKTVNDLPQSKILQANQLFSNARIASQLAINERSRSQQSHHEKSEPNQKTMRTQRKRLKSYSSIDKPKIKVADQIIDANMRLDGIQFQIKHHYRKYTAFLPVISGQI